MDFKKYLVVLIFFVLGVVVGKNMPAFNSESNTAATTTGSNTVVAPTSDSKTTTTTNTSNTFVPQTNTYDPYAIAPTTNTTTTTTTQPQTYTNPPSTTTTDVKPVTTTNPTSPVVTSNASVVYAGVSPLTKNVSRGNIYNDREQVKDLQEFLILQKFLTGSADGSFGPMTQQAVIRYQQANRISPAVGYVGPITREHINITIGRAKPTCSCTPLGGGKGYYAGSACQWHDACNSAS